MKHYKTNGKNVGLTYAEYHKIQNVIIMYHLIYTEIYDLLKTFHIYMQPIQKNHFLDIGR